MVTKFGRSQASKIFVPSLPVVWVTAGRVPVSKHSKMVLIKADFPDPAIPNSTIFKRKPSISPCRASSNRSYAPTLYSINLSTSCSISLAGGSIGAMIVFLGIRWLFLSWKASLFLPKRGIICYSDAFTKRKGSIHSDHWIHNTLTSRKLFPRNILPTFESSDRWFPKCIHTYSPKIRYLTLLCVFSFIVWE